MQAVPILQSTPIKAYFAAKGCRLEYRQPRPFFQKNMESILQRVPHVSIYIDDVLLTGTTRKEHLRTLETVLSRLQQAGLKLKRSKCSFFASSIEYLGHIISADGLHPTDEKVCAVRNAPTPTNVSQLQFF